MAEPRRPASRGGPKGRPPPGLPPAINHLPFSIRPGDVRARGRRASFSSFASSMVLAYGQVLVRVIPTLDYQHSSSGISRSSSGVASPSTAAEASLSGASIMLGATACL